MDFDLSKPQKLLKQTARDFLARECRAERVRDAIASDDAFDAQLWGAIVDQGWTGLIVPEAQGGLGLGSVELAAVMEEAGRACMPGPLLSTVFATAVINATGSAEQKHHFLEPIAAGTMRATVATPEYGTLKASLNREAFSLSGETPFVLDAGVADVIFCIARSGEELIVLPVERGTQGLIVRRTPAMDETRKTYTVSFDGVRVDQASAMRGSAESIAAAVDLATAALCAEMVGGMQWILDTSVNYAKTRQQFGRVIGSFQAVQHLCADMLLLLESARSAAYFAAWAQTPLATSVAKAYCSDAYREVANRGVQVHGGIGFTWEHDLQLYYKRSKASETLFGDATFHRERIATLVVDRAATVTTRQDVEAVTQ
jgi:alkylation response protein AidB-like acyl-CoA dehydrogenase